MKNRIISKGMFLEGLRRIKVPSIIFAAIILLIQVIVPVSQYTVRMYLVNGVQLIQVSEVMNPLAIVPSVMTPILILVAFNAFNKRSSSDFYQSLPYSRSCIFFSWTLAVLAVAAALIVAGGLLGYASRIVFPNMQVADMSEMGPVLLWYLAAMLFAAGCVLVAVSLTGTFISNVVCALLIMFLPRMIMVIIRALIVEMTPVVDHDFFLPWMNIGYNVFIICLGFGAFGLLGSSGAYFFSDIGGYSTVFGMTKACVFTLVIALIYIACAALLFKHRKSETATLSGTSRTVQHIIRIALTLAISLFATYLITELNDKVLGIIFYFIALIVFFAYEIITTKKWINLVKILPTLLIIAALNAGVWGVSYMIRNAIINQHTAAENIRYVRIIDTMANTYIKNRTNDIRLEDETIKAMVAQALETDLETIRRDKYNSSWYDRVPNSAPGSSLGTYHAEYKDAKLIAINTGAGEFYRYIRFTEPQQETMSKVLASTEGYRQAYMDIPEAVTDTITVSFTDNTPPYGVKWATGRGFSSQDAVMLFETLKAEINEIGFQEWYMDLATGFITDSRYIRMQYRDAGNEEINIPLTAEYTPKTYTLALELISEAQSEDRNELITAAKRALGHETIPGSENGESSYIYADLYVTDENGQVQNYTSSNDMGPDQDGFKVFQLIEKAESMSEPATADRMMIVHYEINVYAIDEYVRSSFGNVILPVPEDFMEYVLQ